MRYAIYFTPPAEAPLTRAASNWLGRDAFTDATIAQTAVDGISPQRLLELTADPRRYGFHATLKAPFELASGQTEADLLAAFSAFCAKQSAFEIPNAVIGQLGKFFALVPEETYQPLQDFASAVVQVFEPFRAPLSPEDMARRKPEKLSQAERNNLERWGYPYVFDAFRFHMTLSGQVPEAEAPAIGAALDRHFAGLVPMPLAVNGLGLFREETRGTAFTVQTWLPLAGA